jgi:hypothetical protein
MTPRPPQTPQAPTSRRPWRQALSPLALLFALLLAGPGCAIVDPDKVDGLRSAAEWKSQADTYLKSPGLEAARDNYGRARAGVNGWLDNLADRADAIKSNPFARLTVTADQVPADVRAKVEEFFTAARSRNPAVVIGVAAFEEFYDLVKKSRDEAAKEFRASLAKYHWSDWDAARRPAPAGGGGS